MFNENYVEKAKELLKANYYDLPPREKKIVEKIRDDLFSASLFNISNITCQITYLAILHATEHLERQEELTSNETQRRLLREV